MATFLTYSTPLRLSPPSSPPPPPPHLPLHQLFPSSLPPISVTSFAPLTSPSLFLFIFFAFTLFNSLTSLSFSSSHFRHFTPLTSSPSPLHFLVVKPSLFLPQLIPPLSLPPFLRLHHSYPSSYLSIILSSSSPYTHVSSAVCLTVSVPPFCCH